MPKATVSTTAWTEITTTTADTAFQNQNGNRPMYLTTEDTTNLPFSEGLHVPPNMVVVIGEGNTVSAVTFGSEGDVFYMEV